MRAPGGRNHPSTWWSESPSPPPSPGVPGEGGRALSAPHAIALSASRPRPDCDSSDFDGRWSHRKRSTMLRPRSYLALSAACTAALTFAGCSAPTATAPSVRPAPAVQPTTTVAAATTTHAAPGPKPAGDNLGRALRDAAKSGDLNRISSVLAQGVDVNATTPAGETALHVAAREGRTDSIKALLQHGAQLEGRAGDGGTP